MKKFNFSVTVLLLREENRWVAQCLEYDIAAQSDSIAGVKNAFSKAFVSQVAVNLRFGKRPLQNIPKPPAYYRQLFKSAERMVDRPTFALPKQMLPQVTIAARAKEMRDRGLRRRCATTNPFMSVKEKLGTVKPEGSKSCSASSKNEK